MLLTNKVQSTPAEESYFTINNSSSVVENGTTINGTITSIGNIHLNGSFKGDVNSEAKVIIGPKADIQGEINAATVLVEGKVRGNVVATQTVTVKPTACIEGDVSTSKLIMEEGAVLNGQCFIENSLEGGHAFQVA